MNEFLNALDTKIAKLTEAQTILRKALISEEATADEKEAAFQAVREAASEIVATPHF